MSAATGAELFLWGKLKLVCIVYFGVTLAVTSELHFNSFGFLCQAASSVAECARVVLMKSRLEGLKLDALTLLSYYAPLCFALLVPGALLTERPADASKWVADFNKEVGVPLILSYYA